MLFPTPARPVIAGLLLTGAGVLALTFAARAQLVQAPRAPVIKQVVVLGAEHASEVSIRHLADLREGQSLMVDLDRVVEKVKQHPWVDEVNVSRDLSGTVRIAVTEHQPALLLAHDGLYRVSGEGEVFLRARSSDLDLPVLTGLDSQLIEAHGEVGRAVVHSALAILSALDGRESLSAAALSEIHFDRALGFSLILRSGTIIHLGFGDPTERLDRLDAIVREGLQLDTPYEVDLDMADRAVVTPLSS